jgi:hypothetical protein
MRGKIWAALITFLALGAAPAAHAKVVESVT